MNSGFYRYCVSVEVLESVQELGDRDANADYVEELFNDVEALSDSDVDMDTISVRSTPKPKLRYVSKYLGQAQTLCDL